MPLTSLFTCSSIMFLDRVYTCVSECYWTQNLLVHKSFIAFSDSAFWPCLLEEATKHKMCLGIECENRTLKCVDTSKI